MSKQCKEDCLNCKLNKCIYETSREVRPYHLVKSGVKIGDRLKKVLKKKGMKQVELSKVTGITNAAITHYIKGHTLPRLDHVIVICRVLHISADWLLGLVPDEE